MAENEPGTVTGREQKLKSQVDELQKQVAALAKGLKKAADEIESEWGTQIVPEGEVISGIRF